MTLPQEIIRAKRDGRDLSEAEIGEFIAGLTSGAVTEGQAAAFAMAVFFNGMTLDERIALTRAMTLSGETIDWRAPDLPGPILDKHSTGGVGDNVSLMLAPMLAACGAFVPMISGRGLGHTGGTLDKLDSIPGYVTQPDLLTLQARRARGGLRHHRPDGRPRPGRQAPLRDPRRDRDRRVGRADHGVDPVEEACRRPRRPGHGREDRLGRLHGHARGRARTGREHRDGRDRRRPADRFPDHRHERAARQRRRQRRRSPQRRRFSRRTSPRRAARASDARAGRRASGSLRPGQVRGRGKRADATHARIGRSGRALRTHGRGARRPAPIFSPAPKPRCPAPALSSKRSRSGAARSRASTCARSDSRWSNSAAAGRALPIPSIRRSASPSFSRSAPTSGRIRLSPGSTPAAPTTPKPRRGVSARLTGWATSPAERTAAVVARIAAGN